MNVNENMIPRKIWMLWFQGKAKAPYIVKKCIDSWVRENPTWEIVFLDENNLDTYVDLDIPQETLANLTLQLQSDLIRLVLLSKYGGVWADATTFCMRPLNEWVDDAAKSGFFVFHKPGPDRLMSSWFMASQKDSPICVKLYGKLKKYLIENNFQRPNKDQQQAVKVLSKFFNESFETTKHWFDPVVTRVLGVQPYFVLHYMFERLVSEDQECKAIWEQTERISADLPHLIQQAGFFSFPSDALKNRINRNEIQLFKLNWRYDQSKYSKDTLLYYLLEERMNPKEVDLLRDAALLLEDKNLDMAYDLMSLAYKHRPNGSFIHRKLHEYKDKFHVDNGFINIHFGVHKTATTYIQENLELVTQDDFHYTKLDEYRELLRETGYMSYLSSLDRNKKTVISDENMAGGLDTVLTGALYPNFEKNVNKYLAPFKNRQLVDVYISIRPMTSFMPSLYCEYLRFNHFKTYEEYTSKVSVDRLRWIDVLREAITSNSDMQFFIFDFASFAENKDLLLRKLSFGCKSSCDPKIERSRQAFTFKEISDLSNGQFVSNDNAKFDPHTEEEKKQSMIHYQNDMAQLSELPNVNVLS